LPPITVVPPLMKEPLRLSPMPVTSSFPPETVTLAPLTVAPNTMVPPLRTMSLNSVPLP